MKSMLPPPTIAVYDIEYYLNNGLFSSFLNMIDEATEMAYGQPAWPQDFKKHLDNAREASAKKTKQWRERFL